MKQRHVRFTATAREHVKREKVWWLENRIHTEVFAAEFEEALKILAVRIYLRKVTCHIYYTFDEHEVIIRAFWGARRGRGPIVES